MTPELILINKYVKKIFPIITSISSVEIVVSNKMANQTRLEVNIYITPTHYCEIHYNWVTEQKILKQMNDKTHHIFKSIIFDWDGKQINFKFFPDVNLTNPTILEELNIVEEIEECPF
jgi:hypothetical protein